MKLDRETINRLLYGTDQQRRFTLDNPIQADVWERFLLLGQERQRRLAANPKDRAPEPRVSLLLTPKLTRGENDEIPGSAALLAEALRRRVLRLAPNAPRPERGTAAEYNGLAALRIAATEQYVAIDLTFREVMDLLVPLTDWWWRKENKPLRDYVQRPGKWPDEPRARRFLMLASLTDQLLSPKPEVKDAIEGLFRFFEPAQEEAFPEFGATPGLQATRQREADALPAPMALPEDSWASAQSFRKPIGPAEHTPALPRIWTIARNARAVPVSLGPGFQGQKTVKADAARLLFNIKTAHLTWAIVDSGIDQTHPAFREDPAQKAPGRPGKAKAAAPANRVLGRLDFTKLRRLLSEEGTTKTRSDAAKESMRSLWRRNTNGRSLDWALIEPLIRVEEPKPPESLHGTHVAGILAGNMPDGPIPGEPESGLIGICPDIKLLDLKVFP
ncbi:MAG: S8 family serine peptidase, partial [Alphaproteobacteria bacterium]